MSRHLKPDDVITAQIVCDSVTRQGHRLTTLQYCFPTYLLAQLNTHRVFSRNARSARATPINTLMEEVTCRPVIPYFGVNQPGMTAGSLPYTVSEDELINTWLQARDSAIESAKILHGHNVHKQTVNRLFAPFSLTIGLISSTEWANFLKLRLAPEAEPLMQILARKINTALEGSTPIELPVGAWHLPYVLPSDVRKLPIETAICMSVARCARVSVKPFNGDNMGNQVESDLRLYNTLLTSGHMSPFEHVACVPSFGERVDIAFKALGDLFWYQRVDTRYGNFSGWLQYRKMVENRIN